MRFYIDSDCKIEKQIEANHKDLGVIKVKATIVDAAKLYLIAKRQDSDHYSYYSRSLKRCTYLLGNANVFKTKELAQAELEVIKTTRKGFKSFMVDTLDNHYVNNWHVDQDDYSQEFKLIVNNELVPITDFKDFNKNATKGYYRRGEALDMLEAIEKYTKGLISVNTSLENRISDLEKQKQEFLNKLRNNKQRVQHLDNLEELEQLAKDFTGGRESVVRMLHGKV